MKNKILAFGIILCMLFSMAVVPASAATSGTCGENVTWILDDEGTLTISGTGEMTDIYSNDSDVPWYSLRSTIKTVTIENGVASVGASAFMYCQSLTSVTISDSVTKIGNSAFNNCSSLTSVTIPDSVITIGNGAFFKCSSLEAITISDSVTSIGEDAFCGCSSLTSIKIPNNIINIEAGTFNSCSNLASVIMPDSVTRIGIGAFYWCSSLLDIYYGGTSSQWNAVKKESSSVAIYPSPVDSLKSATIHYNSIFANKLTDETDYNGETVSLPDGAVLDTGENLNFRNGYVNTGNSGYVKAGDKKIAGSNVHFTNDGKIRLDAGDTAKVSRDNGDGTTDQGFIVGVSNPKNVVTMTLEVNGTMDYTGRTITKDFDFTGSEIYGLVNFGFEVKRVPKPLELAIQRIE